MHYNFLYWDSIKEKRRYNDFQIIIKNITQDYHYYFYDCKFPNNYGYKKNKVCRFCGKNYTQTIFDNRSHSISEAFGNKKVFTLDECKNCNTNFSSLEKDIVTFFEFFRFFTFTKGKKGSKKIEDKNFTLYYTSNPRDVNISEKNFLVLETKTTDLNNLRIKRKIIPANIYKCLCKYALSLVPNIYLPYFKNTINWLTGKYHFNNLPNIIINMKDNCEEPKINIFIKRELQNNLPFAFAELLIMNLHILFLIPINTINNNISIFNKYYYTKPFIQVGQQINLSNETPMDFIQPLNFDF